MGDMIIKSGYIKMCHLKYYPKIACKKFFGTELHNIGD
jgi:hypothetical protein